MPGRLRIYLPDAPVKEVLLRSGCCYLLGRDEAADIALADPRISRRHLLIDTRQQPWRLTDQASKNGTLLDGLPVDSAPLPERTWLSLGGVPAEFAHLTPDQAARWHTARHQARHTTLKFRQRLHPGTDEAELLDGALASFLALADCTAGALFLLTESGPKMRVLTGETAFSGSRHALQSVLARGHRMVVCDTAADDELAARRSIAAGRVRALACVPLVLEGRVIGALYAHSRTAGKVFTELDLELLEAIAAQAAFALGVGRIRDRIAALGRDLPASIEVLEHDSELSRLLRDEVKAYPSLT